MAAAGRCAQDRDARGRQRGSCGGSMITMALTGADSSSAPCWISSGRYARRGSRRRSPCRSAHRNRAQRSRNAHRSHSDHRLQSVRSHFYCAPSALVSALEPTGKLAGSRRELRLRTDVQLFHDPLTLRCDEIGVAAKLSGDLFVCFPVGEAPKQFLLLRRQLVVVRL